jgi:hypothetical protein
MVAEPPLSVKPPRFRIPPGAGRPDEELSVFVQVFEGWRYQPGARDRIAALDLGNAPAAAPRPDIPGLIARLVATDPKDPDTGIGLWVWHDEDACRAYEANRPVDVQALIGQDLDHSAMTERVFDVLLFGCRVGAPLAHDADANA